MRGGAGWRSDPSPLGPRPAPAGSLPARPACGRPALSCGPSPARYAPARTGGRTRLPAGRRQQTARGTGFGDAGSAEPEGSAAPKDSAAPAPFCLPARSSLMGLMSSPDAGLLRVARKVEIFFWPPPPCITAAARRGLRGPPSRKREPGGPPGGTVSDRRRGCCAPAHAPDGSLHCPTPSHRACPPPAESELKSTRNGLRKGEGL